MKYEIIENKKKPRHPNHGIYDELVECARTLEIGYAFKHKGEQGQLCGIRDKLKYLRNEEKRLMKFQCWYEDGIWIKRVPIL